MSARTGPVSLISPGLIPGRLTTGTSPPAAAGADRLVVEVVARSCLVGFGPFGVDRIRKRSTSARNIGGDDCMARCTESNHQYREAFEKSREVHLGHPPVST